MVETQITIGGLKVAGNSALRDAAQRLLDAAMAYWNVYSETNGCDAVVWVRDRQGRMVVLTRGEYRDVIMTNIAALGRGARPIVAFGDDRDHTQEGQQ